MHTPTPYPRRERRDTTGGTTPITWPREPSGLPSAWALQRSALDADAVKAHVEAMPDREAAKPNRCQRRAAMQAIRRIGRGLGRSLEHARAKRHGACAWPPKWQRVAA